MKIYRCTNGDPLNRYQPPGHFEPFWKRTSKDVVPTKPTNKDGSNSREKSTKKRRKKGEKDKRREQTEKDFQPRRRNEKRDLTENTSKHEEKSRKSESISDTDIERKHNRKQTSSESMAPGGSSNIDSEITNEHKVVRLIIRSNVEQTDCRNTEDS